MPRLALRMRVINYLLILVFSTLYSYHQLRLKATKIFSFLWFSLFSGLFVFIWESMQAGGELLFCLGFVSSVFFSLFWWELISQTQLEYIFPYLQDTTQFYRNANYSIFSKLTQNLRFYSTNQAVITRLTARYALQIPPSLFLLLLFFHNVATTRRFIH